MLTAELEENKRKLYQYSFSVRRTEGGYLLVVTLRWIGVGGIWHFLSLWSLSTRPDKLS